MAITGLRIRRTSIILLDEPTNNLDIASVEQLVGALADYRGSILVVSHDYPFLRRIGIDTVVELEPSGHIQQRGSL